jgi:hypothetical protein
MKNIHLSILMVLMFCLPMYPVFGQQWATNPATSNNNNDGGTAIARDAQGNVYGAFGLNYFDNVFNTAGYTSFQDLLVKKYDPAGNPLLSISITASGGPASAYANAINDIDVQGNYFYVVGTFNYTIQFTSTTGPITLSTGNGNQDIFFAKFDNFSGLCYWAYKIGGTQRDIATTIDVDSNNDIYIGGSFSSLNVDFDVTGGQKLLSSTNTFANDMFLIKYTQDFINNIYFGWGNKYGGAGDDYINRICESGAYIYITGSFGGTVNFNPSGTTNLSSNGSGDILVARYLKADGNLLPGGQLNAIGTVNNDFGTDIFLKDGYIYLCGSFGGGSGGSADFDVYPTTSYPLAYSSQGSAFFAKYNENDMSIVWGRSLYSGSSTATSIHATTGFVYTTGYFVGNGLDIDPGNNIFSISSNSQDFFVIRYNADGSFAGGFNVGGNQADKATAILADGQGSFYVTGDFFAPSTNALDFEPMPGDNPAMTLYSDNTEFDAFLVKYSDNVVLPIILEKLGASKDDEHINLNWRTLSEQNNKGFNIQRYTSGTWGNIGFVAGAGNSTTPKDYSFTDIPKQSGTILYRLEQVDFDGKKTLSNVVKVDMGVMKFKAEAYPNPASTQTSVAYTLPEDAQVLLQLFNTKGQLVRTVVNEKQKAGYHLPMIYTSAMAKGVYYYTLTAGKHKAEGKILVN